MDERLEALRDLSDKATPGHWHRYTVGHRSVRQAAGAVTQALFNVDVEPDVRPLMTDLSWVETDAVEAHVALIGNGPKQTDNADFIAAAVNYVRSALARPAEPEPGEDEALRKVIYDHTAHVLGSTDRDALYAAIQGSGLDVERLASALYETDPPESWMRTGTDEYRKRAAAMLDIIAREYAALSEGKERDRG